ncbi:hypothetical protein TRAPUB_899 [Trametes pubescens]|uniref:C2H2-type domain-containing protein n=1 Tax=Trametes pubescens TaxID=154538 RepID=A0A1M2VKY7_TRAPU|nr:hypothetical protein TRAPUB_899 [Trametes pubescens]
MSRRRMHHGANELKCPHCVKPEKWCKNLSGLTQHINAMHIELLRAPSPLSPSPSPTPEGIQAHSPPPDPAAALASPPSESNHSQELGDDGARQHVLLEDGEPKHRDYHLRLNARPCNEAGEYLHGDSTPTPRTDTEFGDWGPFANQVEFELTEFLFQREQMPQTNIDTLMDLWAADVLRYGGHPPFADHADLYRAIDAIRTGDVPWTCLKVSYSGTRPDGDVPSWMDATYEIWFRDPRRVALKMLANPDFHDLFDVVPYREFTAGGERRYGHMMSGNWAWKQAFQPYTAEFPRANINELLSGDLLHQVIKGTFKDHLVSWVGEYLTQTHGEARGKELLDEIDRRYTD